jgi:hypothetical protein
MSKQAGERALSQRLPGQAQISGIALQDLVNTRQRVINDP